MAIGACATIVVYSEACKCYEITLTIFVEWPLVPRWCMRDKRRSVLWPKFYQVETTKSVWERFGGDLLALGLEIATFRKTLCTYS